MRLTNTTRETIDVIVKGEAKNGVPPTEGIAPGETKAVNAADNPSLQGHLFAGSLVEAAGESRKAAAKE